MRAITLHQPWASLIAHGVKDIETRSWPPPQTMVGQRIAIHAGKRIVGPRSLNLETQEAIEGLYGPQWPKVIPAGAVVATAVLSRVAKSLPRGMAASGWWMGRLPAKWPTIITVTLAQAGGCGS